MKLISHRGNINGKILELENSPDYLEEALIKQYDVEIDVWYKNDKWFLGHDNPEYRIDFEWLYKNRGKLWLHCKNINAVIELYKMKQEVNFFWHQEDILTITSLGYLWVYPGNQPLYNSIAVLPEIYNDNISKCIGVCSDFILKY